MVEKIINAVLDVVKSLLPNQNLSTPAWIIRLSFLGVLVVGIVVGIKDTPLGDRIGLSKQVELPALTHTEVVKNFKQSYEEISQLRESDPNVRASFLVTLVDNSTNNIVLTNEVKDTRLMFWAWSLPVDKYSYLDVFERAFNGVKGEFQSKLNDGSCLSGAIQKPVLEQLKRGVYDFQSTHFSICPIFTSKNKRLIAAAIALYKQPDSLQLYFYEDKLQRAASAISTLFYSFSEKYQIIFD
ncbi:hypothetical protein [Scytonema sp. PCC 10023]|uniref:hypothetical protein n=1 Tax=Scytonema sp. PCC 10023 TaxID=1680591 RepID=UPI0039C64A8A